MIKPSDFRRDDLGELKHIVPEHDPVLQLAINRIPVIEGQASIIPVCEPTLTGNEGEYITHCIETNWISSAGGYINKFEDMFAEFCGSKHAVSCLNGTIALHLSLYALGIGKGDEVIIPSFTMIATANAVTYTGAEPVLVDSEFNTWNIDTSKIEEKITKKTKAIIPVHTYGHPCDMDEILKLAKKNNLYVIEDAAEAHGAEYKGNKAGSMGDAGCFSFYANKMITTGEGGMIVTNDSEYAKLMKNLRDHAFSQERHFWHCFIGYNYRMTNMQAAIGVAQMEKIDDFIKMRINNARLYNEYLKDINGIVLPPQSNEVKNVYWMYSIMVDKDKYGCNRDELRNILAKNGIETRTFFVPMHIQPVYYDKLRGSYPIAEKLCEQGLYLPSFSHLSSEQIIFITNVIKENKK